MKSAQAPLKRSAKRILMTIRLFFSPPPAAAQVQNRIMPPVRGERRLQVRREVPVRPRLPRAARPGQASQVQDGAVPHVPRRGLLPVRRPLPLHPRGAQPGQG